MNDFPILAPNDFSQCLVYLRHHEERQELPERSPRRPKTMPEFGTHDYTQQPTQFDLPKLHSYDAEYTSIPQRMASASSSIFSFDIDTKREPLDNATLEQFLDEIDFDDEICLVEDVVKIAKCHDQCDALKVSIVATH